MKKIQLLLILCAWFTIHTKSQPWLNNLSENKNGDYNFYDICSYEKPVAEEISKVGLGTPQSSGVWEGRRWILEKI